MSSILDQLDHPDSKMHRAAMKKTWKYTKKFAEDMYKSLGARFLFFVAMETPTGSINTGIMDFNDVLGGGASYAAKHSNWKTEGICYDFPLSQSLLVTFSLLS